MPTLNTAQDVLDSILSIDGEGGEALELTPHEIYSELLDKNELLFTILPEHEAAFRTGLIQVKAKENMKLKEQGVPTDSSVLSFVVTPSSLVHGAIQIHVLLAKRKTIPIISMVEPDKEI